MTDEFRLRKDVDRANRAELLLKDDLIAEAFDALSREYTDAWLGTGARDTDARERLWLAVQIVGKVKANLETVVRNGTLAKAELAAISKDERRKIFGVI